MYLFLCQPLQTSVVPDPDFWILIRKIYEIFWIRSRIGYHFCSSRIRIIQNGLNIFQFFCVCFFSAKILLITWEFWCWMMWFILFFNLSRLVDFHTAVVRWRESNVLQSPLAMAIAYIVRRVSKVGVLFAPSKKPTFQKLSNVSMCIQSVAGWDWVSQH